MVERIQEEMLAHGFGQVVDGEGTPIRGLFTRVENPVCYCVYFTEEESFPDFFSKYILGLEKMLPKLYCIHLVKLYIHTQREITPLPEVYSETAHSIYWWYDMENNRIVPRKGDPSKLIGVEKILMGSQKNEKVDKLHLAMPKGDKPYVCMHVGIICLLVLVAMLFWDTDALLVQTFALKRSAILEGEVYRFVTAMFLHSGWMHLFSNGIILYYFGTQVESILGHKKFLLAYLFCGLTCGIASILWNDVYSLGASGGLFGMMMLTLLYTKKYGALGFGRMNHATLLIFALYATFMGFTNSTTDNLGHLGGLLGGVLVYALLVWKKVDK